MTMVIQSTILLPNPFLAQYFLCESLISLEFLAVLFLILKILGSLGRIFALGLAIRWGISAS